jgi:hypothetical protein
LMISVHLSLSHFSSEYDAGFKEGLSKCEQCPVCNETRPIVIINRTIPKEDGAILIDIAG